MVSPFFLYRFYIVFEFLGFGFMRMDEDKVRLEWERCRAIVVFDV